MLASFAFVTFYYGAVTDSQIQAAVGNVGARELTEVRAAEDEALTRYKFVDKAKGKVLLPVDRAMDLLEQEAKAGLLFYPAKPTPVKSAADLAAGGGTVPAVMPVAVPAAGATPATGEHEKK